ncbi:porin [Rhodalgimonas zhirmunskyi]|uniref:Porin n=1 Tax=Rhodalgimonas zhirmunskyi TaxID=2964767 RepID=A0AAJ1U6Z8_9RHOB|nr:porin [Rhodoalgimonas zhirmunskyi]MDQ2094190.1 porin [Rhodoalgimonas zhirmunskyi]
MKKILFATTALVATAGVAAADVSFSGYGRFGAISTEGSAQTGTAAQRAAAAAALTAASAAHAPNVAALTAAQTAYTANPTAANGAALLAAQGVAAGSAAALAGASATNNLLNGSPDITGIYTRIRLQIDMTTEADNGLTFGARLRMQDTSVDGAGYGNGGTTTGGFNGARFYAKMGGLEIGVGNIIGAIEGMSGLYMSTQSGDIGLSGLGFHSLVTNTVAQGYWGWDAYSSGGAGVDGVEVMYSAGDFSGHLSYSNGGGVSTTGLNVAYSFNDWTVALGYQDGDTNAARDKAVITVGGKIGPVNVGLAYADNNGTGKVALTGQVEVGAATRIDMFVSSDDSSVNTAGYNVNLDPSYGLAVSHSLGGGASVEGGVVRTPFGTTSADLGIKFNF